MLLAIETGVLLPPIELAQFEDGSIQLEDGHHRLMAYYLSGRTSLHSNEYILTQKENHIRHRCGKIQNLEICYAK